MSRAARWWVAGAVVLILWGRAPGRLGRRLGLIASGEGELRRSWERN